MRMRAPVIHQLTAYGPWALAEAQHGVVARDQLIVFGFSVAAIEHRLATGRLHHFRRGVYAVGRPGLTQHGIWMAAVLCCGPGAALSHVDAAALWDLRLGERSDIHVSVPTSSRRRHVGIVVHRRPSLDSGDVTSH